MDISPLAIFVMDKVYIGFEELYRIHTNNVYSVTRTIQFSQIL